MKARRRWALALALATALAAAAFGADDSERGVAAWAAGSEPLQVDSDSLEFKATEGRVIFLGNVLARQGDLTVQADTVEVRVDPETRQILAMEAVGNVRIEKDEVVAVGRRSTYDAATGVVVLTGEPKVWRDRDVVTGEKITLFLSEDRSVVEGARAILYPGSSTKKDESSRDKPVVTGSQDEQGDNAVHRELPSE